MEISSAATLIFEIDSRLRQMLFERWNSWNFSSKYQM
jgi:hypothetical protein